jgi:hypothetical protein
MDEFNYVIARKWYPDTDKNQLNCYAYGSTVFHGNMEDAISTRDFIRGRDDEHQDEYEIYKISDEPLKLN